MSRQVEAGQAAEGTHLASLRRKEIVAAAAMTASSASLSLTITLYLLGRANPIQATRSWLAILAACFLALIWQHTRCLRTLLRLPPRHRESALSWILALNVAVLLATLPVIAGYYLSDDVNFRYMGNWGIRTVLALLISVLLLAALEVPRALLATIHASGAPAGLPEGRAGVYPQPPGRSAAGDKPLPYANDFSDGPPELCHREIRESRNRGFSRWWPGTDRLKPRFLWDKALVVRQSGDDRYRHAEPQRSISPPRERSLREAQGKLFAIAQDDTCQVHPGAELGGGSLMEALRFQVRTRAPGVLLAVVAVVGLLEATSFVTTMGDDYARYWTIADAISGGWGYPASEVGDIYQRGGMSGYLVDLPALPLAMVASFALLGHTVLAAMAPAIVVTASFPLAAYLALRELTGHTVVSFVAALALGMFPLLSFYVVRSAEPDGIFITLLMAMAFLAMRTDRRAQGVGAGANSHHEGARRERESEKARKREIVPRISLPCFLASLLPSRLRVFVVSGQALTDWAALGLLAGVVALTRPEGIMFAGVTFLTLSLRHIACRGFWVGGAVCGALVAAFSLVMLLTFGKPWPTSFMGTVKLAHIPQNLDGFVVWSLPRYSESLGVPVPALALAGALLALLYAAGAWQIARHRPQLLFLVLLPAMSLTSFLLVSPWLTRPPFPYDFFRRASYGLPFLALVAAYPVASALRQVSAFRQRLALCSTLVALSVLLIAYEAKLEATPEAIYEGGTKLLTSGSYVMATDLLAHPFDLPRMTFERVEGVLLVAGSFDYMAFRTELTAFFKPMDLHGVDRAASYPRASLLLFLVGLCYAIVGDGSHDPDRQRSKQCTVT